MMKSDEILAKIIADETEWCHSKERTKPCGIDFYRRTVEICSKCIVEWARKKAEEK